MNEIFQPDNWRNHIDIDPDSIIIFGSYARNDYNEHSDIDLLLIHPEYYPAVQIDKLSISIYSIEKLIKLAENGSLFVLHLINEGKVLEGKNYMEILAYHFKMPDFNLLKSELFESCKILQIYEEDFNKYKFNIIGVQKFILRSILYMNGIQKGVKTFNILKVLEFLGLTELFYIFNREYQCKIDYDQFQKINTIIEDLLNFKFAEYIYSIESIILNNYPNKNLLHALGMSVLKKDSIGIDYPNLIF